MKIDKNKNMFSLKGKTSVVTGAARGNGKEIAISFAKNGANVILIDKLLPELKKLKKELKKYKVTTKFFLCDLSSLEEIKDLISKIKKEKIYIDILVNNAGVSFSSTSKIYPDDLWEKTYKVNLKAPFLLSSGLINNFNKNSSIINITSLGAELGFYNNVAYQTFKGALRQMTKSMAMDYAKFKIRVNNLSPGYIKTNMTKKSFSNKTRRNKLINKTILGRLGTSKDLIGTVIFLSSLASEYITAQDLRVDGGYTYKGDV